MLTQDIKKKIDSARNILVGKVPDPKAQVEQITTALIYKFMDDMDKQAASLPKGKAQFFTNGFEKYAWGKLMDSKLGGQERLNLYVEAITKMSKNPHLPQLFRDVFKDAFLPYRDPETLNLFLKEINGFLYDHSENLGNAFEYLLSVLGSQGDAGQFRTPRHIIDFIVEIVDPKKDESILDPACGTAGFLISAYKHIIKTNKNKPLTPDEKKRLMSNLVGYDISPDMVKLSLVNMYLHGFSSPNIYEYDTLTSDERWEDRFDVMMANPPFMTPKGGIRPHNRFAVAANRSEVLFVDYILEHLNNNGRAGIVVPEGIISTHSAAHTRLRKMMVEFSLYAVVSLPSGVFKPYSGVKTYILLLDKAKAKQKSEVLFVDIKNDGFTLGDSRLPISQNDLPAALKSIQNFYEGESVDFAYTVSKEKILQNRSHILIGKRYKERGVSNGSYPEVSIGESCSIEKGLSPTLKTKPGNYPLVVTASEKKTSDHFDFEGEAVCIPLISSTGHGHASMKRLHYQNGQFALANTMCALFPKDKKRLNAKYLYYVLSHKKDELLVPLMKGAANVSMKPSDLESVYYPLPPISIQKKIVKELDTYHEKIHQLTTVFQQKKLEKISEIWGE